VNQQVSKVIQKKRPVKQAAFLFLGRFLAQILAQRWRLNARALQLNALTGPFGRWLD